MKEGKTKTVTEVLDRPFLRYHPPKPLVTLADESSWTLLHWAAFKNHREVCTVLLRYNADILARDCTGNTAFQLASCNGSEEVSLFLMDRMAKHDQSWALNAGNLLGSTALVDAASNGHHALAEKLYKAKCDWMPQKEADVAHPPKEKDTKDTKRPGSGNKEKRPGSGKGTPGSSPKEKASLK